MVLLLSALDVGAGVVTLPVWVALPLTLIFTAGYETLRACLKHAAQSRTLQATPSPPPPSTSMHICCSSDAPLQCSEDKWWARSFYHHLLFVPFFYTSPSPSLSLSLNSCKSLVSARTLIHYSYKALGLRYARPVSMIPELTGSTENSDGRGGGGKAYQKTPYRWFFGDA